MTRKSFISSSFATLASLSAGEMFAAGVGGKYAGWSEGELDIHFIHTGTGEQTFFVFPDGTTMLLDCGHEKSRSPEYVAAIPARPDASRRGGEWVARYISRIVKTKTIDYAMVSHWHTDHISEFPLIAESFRFRKFVDHQFPRRCRFPSDLSKDDYSALMESLKVARSQGVEEMGIKVGALNQIRLLHDPQGKYSKDFEIRNIAADGVVWDGADSVRDCVAEHIKATGARSVSENTLSSAIRIRYGKFTYFTGGDLSLKLVDASLRRYSYEGLVGERVGKVDVCKTNHHAYIDAMHSPFVKALRPTVFLSSTWSPNQFNDLNLPIMASRELYSGDRKIFYGHIPNERLHAYARRDFMNDVVTDTGHIVVKVAPGGTSYKVMVLSAKDEDMSILRSFDKQKT
jgi:beta-lactamase superfamily II metal-dependent hydrolase